MYYKQGKNVYKFAREREKKREREIEREERERGDRDYYNVLLINNT